MRLKRALEGGHYNVILIFAYNGKHKHLYNICTMLDQRRRRWAAVVQMLYKCFVFAGIIILFLSLF